MANDSERAQLDDLLTTLAKHRGFLRQTLDGVTDAQAAERSTVSALCLGGLVKHVGAVERQWGQFILQGPEVMAMTPESYAEHAATFRMEPGETVVGLLADYDAIARSTEQIARSLPTLDASQPLPEAPWFEPGASWSARRVLLHMIAETAQHAGHADIIREAIDGAKTMG
jgi:hypothetical protein